jgi:hypothetical protein
MLVTSLGFGRREVSGDFGVMEWRASARRLRALAVVLISGTYKRHEGNGVGDGVRLRKGSKALKGETP